MFCELSHPPELHFKPTGTACLPACLPYWLSVAISLLGLWTFCRDRFHFRRVVWSQASLSQYDHKPCEFWQTWCAWDLFSRNHGHCRIIANGDCAGSSPLVLMLPGIDTNAWFSVHNRFCYISCSAYFFCVFICVLIMRLSNVKAKRHLDISDDD